MGSNDSISSKTIHDTDRIQNVSRNDAYIFGGGKKDLIREDFSRSEKYNICLLFIFSQEMRDIKKFIEKVLKP